MNHRNYPPTQKSKTITVIAQRNITYNRNRKEKKSFCYEFTRGVSITAFEDRLCLSGFLLIAYIEREVLIKLLV